MIRRSARLRLAAFIALQALMQGAVAEPPTPVNLTAAIVRSSKPLEEELRISGSIEKGWHVYATQQLPGGPTPLRVTLAPNHGLTIAGAPAGTTPQTRHDPGFDLDTTFFSQAFTLKLPLYGEIKGPVPVSVRFQACSDRECLPPKTLELQAAVITREGG
jgi:hypothetical protein